MKQYIISNNPLVEKERANLKFEGNLDLNVERSYLEVLYKVRDLVHLGHKLLTHPLSGSIKPGETPYKSVVLTLNKEKIDMQSIEIIEESVTMAKKMIAEARKRVYNERILSDFQLVDYSLIKNSLESINQFR